MHKRRITFIIALAIIMVAAFVGSGMAQSKEDVKSDIPVAILKAFQNEYPDAKITGFEQKTDDSVTVYEIECVVGDTEKDVILSAKGKIIQVEQEIAVSSLPESVSKAALSAFPGAEIEEAEMISRDSIVEYEIVLKIGEKEIEALISANGTIVESKEIADDDDEGHDEDDEDSDDEEDHEDEEDDD